MKKNKVTPDLWPIHFKPKADELLSSWLARLAIAHRLSPQDFYSIEVPDDLNFLTTIDETEDTNILEWISQKTGTHYSDVKAGTIPIYAERSFFKYQLPLGYVIFEWVMPISYKSHNRLFGLQFCPYCLLEDEEPYFRCKWRLAFITHCEKHQAVLFDECPQCSASINFITNANKVRSGISPASIVLCSSCKYDFRQKVSKYPQCTLHPEEIQYQEYLLGLTRGSWWNGWYPGAVTGKSYFKTLHQLIKTLAFEELGQFLRTTIRQSYGLQISPIERVRHDCIERLRVNERRELLDLARHIIKDWPGPFATLEALIKEITPRYRKTQLSYLTEDRAYQTIRREWI